MACCYTEERKKDAIFFSVQKEKNKSFDANGLEQCVALIVVAINYPGTQMRRGKRLGTVSENKVRPFPPVEHGGCAVCKVHGRVKSLESWWGEGD